MVIRGRHRSLAVGAARGPARFADNDLLALGQRLEFAHTDLEVVGDRGLDARRFPERKRVGLDHIHLSSCSEYHDTASGSRVVRRRPRPGFQ